MPILGDVAPPPGKGGKKHPDTVSKIKLNPPTGTARGRFTDFWFYDVNERGLFAKKGEEVAGKKVRIAFELLKHRDDKGNPIVLEKRMKVYLGEKAAFAQFIGAFTGLAPGSDEMKAFDTDRLLNVEAFAQYEHKAKEGVDYTDIKSFFPLEESEPAAAPPQGNDPRAQMRDNPPLADPPKEEFTPITARQKTEINALLQQAFERGWTTENVEKNCLKVSGGRAKDIDGLSAIEANKFFGGLRTMLFKDAQRRSQTGGAR